MAGQDISIKTDTGESFVGYLSLPASGQGPGVVVIQEIFGVNKVMRDIADTYAAQGYVALCPDLFWRIEPGISITDQTEAEWKQAFDLFQKFDVPAGVKDIQATISHLRKQSACTGKVGAVGFCLGGLLAYLSATRTDSDASVGYYGVGIESKLDEAAKISRPLMLHIAGEDEYCGKEAQAQIHAGLDSHSRVTLHDYPGMNHAFARNGGAHYDSAAATLANKRTGDFFSAHLSA
ncbi:dienelactone hydrolase family protein [Oceanibacterium hippocampi]|uniref:Carboxymethylenebutenolidase n=1 Tax=Oceanibacterium hippocampi TaxID=745714 RepID=A0A1Y5RLT6_9PROT|nr:dienelactone hydrolase family protein [Oceanibacterium hippocampi]SLN20559.1 Carboxymethylenebutenolidase [Oceanibacterium hippocampi]